MTSGATVHFRLSGVLKAYRRRYGLTQQGLVDTITATFNDEFAAEVEAHLNQRAVSRWEKGGAVGTPEARDALAHFFGWPHSIAITLCDGGVVTAEDAAGANEDFLVRHPEFSVEHLEATSRAETVATTRAEYRSGQRELTESRAWHSLFAIGVRVANAAHRAGLDVQPGEGSSAPDFIIMKGDEPVAVVEAKMVPTGDSAPVGPRHFALMAEQLQASRLRTSVHLGSGVALVGCFITPDGRAPDLGPYSAELEELQRVYDIRVALGEDQLRWALEQVAHA